MYIAVFRRVRGLAHNDKTFIDLFSTKIELNYDDIISMEEIKGDLFTSDTPLAHCVSSDLVMGKGIAVRFSELFGGKDELKKQSLKIGDVAWLFFNGRYKFIYYLITKEKYWHKPTYSSLRQCLINLNKLCLQHNIKEISIPKLGCGLDKLEWDKVKKIIQEELDNNIKVNVYYL